MYHAIVRRKVAQFFASLSQGDYEFVFAGMAPDFEHTFAGTHAFGGTRHTAAGMRLWLERLFRLNKKLNFTIKHIAVSGTPWNTTVAVEWRDTAILADGDASYFNDGTHVIRMRWGKVFSLHAYLDTQKVVEAFRRMAEQGIAEASAAPIED